jgi:hypothetical protein
LTIYVTASRHAPFFNFTQAIAAFLPSAFLILSLGVKHTGRIRLLSHEAIFVLLVDALPWSRVDAGG